MNASPQQEIRPGENIKIIGVGGAGENESPPDSCTGNEMDDHCKIGHHVWELWVCKVCGAVRR